uniref:Uncharacterized protein n=1 Tax=Anguilla anguilla TaxID=7936 RepID=A0A0E9UAE5_ANGAN
MNYLLIIIYISLVVNFYLPSNMKNE